MFFICSYEWWRGKDWVLSMLRECFTAPADCGTGWSQRSAASNIGKERNGTASLAPSSTLPCPVCITQHLQCLFLHVCLEHYWVKTPSQTFSQHLYLWCNGYLMRSSCGWRTSTWVGSPCLSSSGPTCRTWERSSKTRSRMFRECNALHFCKKPYACVNALNETWLKSQCPGCTPASSNDHPNTHTLTKINGWRMDLWMYSVTDHGGWVIRVRVSLGLVCLYSVFPAHCVMYISRAVFAPSCLAHTLITKR